MAVDLDESDEHLTIPSGLTIQAVHNEETFEEWTHIAASCLQLSDFETYLFDVFADLGFDLSTHYHIGFLKGNPVATSLFFLAAGVAGIYWVGTVPEVRRQGIGIAITLAALLGARAQRYGVGTLYSSPMAYDVYRRLGFQECCKMSHYVMG